MAHFLKKPDGSCCGCEQDLGCGGGCAGVCPGIQSRGRGGLAQLIGFGEFGAASVPPRLYRRWTGSGGYSAKLYAGSGETTCAEGVFLRDESVNYSGVNQYDKTSGALTSGLMATVNDGAPSPVLSATQNAYNAEGCNFSLTTSRTERAHGPRGNCCFEPSADDVWRKVLSASQRDVLSEEDTEPDAIDRLRASPGGAWSAWSGDPLASGSAVAYWQRREGAATAFAYREAEIRVAMGSDAPPGSARTPVVAVRRAPYGSAWEDFVFHDALEVGFFTLPNGSSQHVTAALIPERGWMFWARGCLVREGYPE